MVFKKSIHFTYVIIFFVLGVSLGLTVLADDHGQKSLETKSSTIIAKKIEHIDEIVLKQKEMLTTVVLVQTNNSSGSGTIISRLDIDIEDISRYHVLTNTHVIRPRLRRSIQEVDSLTGKVKTEIVDTGCRIIVFDHKNKKWKYYDTKVIIESNKYDLAILSFTSNKKLAIAKMADKDMLKRVRVFDEVFSIGCQLRRVPAPTVGIISQILTGIHGEQKWVIYGNTAQISPGSSGGGLFKKYDNHYYLIGVPYSVSIAPNGQFVAHLSHAISISTVRNFIDPDLVTTP